MLVIVAIQAKQLPVAPIRRIVVVVVVAMVNSQLAQILAGELPSAAPADPGVDLESLPAIALPALQGGAAGVGDDLVELAGIHRPLELYAPWSRSHFVITSSTLG